MDSHINLEERPKHGASMNYSKWNARKFGQFQSYFVQNKTQ